MSLKILVSGLSGVLGVVCPSTVTAYYQTKLTILDLLSEDVILDSKDESFEAVWETLKTNLNYESDFKSKEIGGIKEKTKEDLKNWCFSKYKEVYWDWFQKENLNLKSDVEKACVHTIEKQLNTNKFEFAGGEEEHKTEFQNRLSKLQSHDSSKGSLDEELINLKKDENSDNKWKKLRDWCKKTYKRGYQGSETNRWKIVQLYCSKQSTL